MRRKEVLGALGIFQRATADQLWRMLRPTDRHDRITRDTLNALKDSGLVRVETRLESGHQLWVLTEKGHKEAKLLLPRNVRVSALRKLEFDDDGEVTGEGFDEHAAAVTMTAAVLTGAGFGTPLSWQTEIGHKLPYGYAQYADLTMQAPDADVPVILLEVDRVNEPVDVLVAKVRRYSEWFELLAPKADKDHERGSEGARLPAVVADLPGDQPRTQVRAEKTARLHAQEAAAREAAEAEAKKNCGLFGRRR
ncbi:replication-relaxation family protein [Streptomyces sp. NPDC056304]|uniref:replication-relaxation family protein n=1 Tax=Streptomyces sp. NPDC056304 TaxID=3345778 RepID=UPI0035E113E8